MSTMQIRQWEKLGLIDPVVQLRKLRKVFNDIPADKLAGVSYKVLSLRRRDLAHVREGRQAALFCIGLSMYLDTPVYFSMIEDSDYDAVVQYVKNDIRYFAPVQLKEFVPPYVNPRAHLQAELNKIAKYGDANRHLVVVFHLNRSDRIEFDKLRYPRNVASLWFVGASEPSQQRWVLIGDMLRQQQFVHHFAYPT